MLYYIVYYNIIIVYYIVIYRISYHYIISHYIVYHIIACYVMSYYIVYHNIISKWPTTLQGATSHGYSAVCRFKNATTAAFLIISVRHSEQHHSIRNDLTCES